MFPPRYHGTVFNVSYEPQPPPKDPLKFGGKAHLITTLNGAEVFSADWRDTFAKFQPADIERLENRKTSVVLVMRPGLQTATMILSTKPEPSDALAAALTQILVIPKPEIRFLALSEILPTCKFPGRREEMEVHKGMMPLAMPIIQAFGGTKYSTTTNGQFVDALTCVYRMRYRNSNIQPINDCTKETGLNVRRRMVVIWCDALLRAIQPSEAPFAFPYFSKLALNLRETIVKASKRLSINADDVLAAASQFAESGSPGNLEGIAKRISDEAQGGINADLATSTPVDEGYFKWSLDLAVITLVGIIVNLYAVDIENFSAVLVRFTRTVVTPGGQVEDAKKEMKQAEALFLRYVLRLLDGQRYDPKFQFIYAIWHLQNQIPNLGSVMVD
jgi:hypothetical protein